MTRLYYYDGDGTSHDLSDPDGNIYACAGQEGFGMPDVDIFEDRAPAVHGSVYRDFLFKPRNIVLPVIIKTGDEASFDTYMEQLMGWLSPFKGMGRLRLIKDDGAIREINCMYTGGLSYSNRGRMEAALPAVLTLRAFDPFWYDPDEYSESYTVGAAGYLLYTPLYSPMYTAGNSASSSLTIAYDGTAPAWPVITLTGPLSTPHIHNETTDKFMTLTSVLGSGDTVEIVTKPGSKAITKTVSGVESSALSERAAGSEFWSLVPGNNVITISLTDAVGAQVEITYQKAYLGV